MTPTIDDIEAALPHVPAGLHCGDLTEPDERRAFAVTVHEIVVRASTDHTAPDHGGLDPLVEWGVDEARVNWPPPSPGTHEFEIPHTRAAWEPGAFLLPGESDDNKGRGGHDEAWDAWRWSRENAR